MKPIYYIVVIILAFGVVACSTSDQTVDPESGEDQANTEESIDTDSDFFATHRTHLSDSYAYRDNEIPEGFTRIRNEQEPERNLYEGYRIQIYSGENVDKADTAAANFRAWADTAISGYQPDAYVFFKAPYYRVHVGDFHNRIKAIQFSNIVKRQFKGAWVVYDRVDPEKVPADTTSIEAK